MPLSSKMYHSLATIENLVTSEMRDGLITQSQFEDMRRRIAILRGDFERISSRYDDLRERVAQQTER